jgi:serine/threonine-protein kinase
VHRDIKPENVLISHDGRVKVADFGLARAVATSDTNATAGVLIGTVAYLAPEQVERGEADARTDVYAAGVCLFEMITGRVPHGGDSPLAVAYQHVNADVPAPSTIASDIPPEADAIVRAATRRDPNQRYRSTADFLADVRRARASLPAPVPFIDTPAINDTLVVGTGDLTDIHDDWARATTSHADYDNDYDDFDDGDFSPRRRSRGGVRLIVGLVIALAVGAAGFAGWWLAAGPGTYSPTPDIVGMSFDQASDVLVAQGLTLAAATEAYSEEIPAGSILASEPEAGAGIRPGGTVSATVSLGPERYPVPDIQGTTPAEATEAIVAAGLATGGRVEVFDDAVPAGQVASTDPAIGDLVPPDTSIDLLISKGPEPVEIEDVSGRKQGVATKRLEEAGLQVTASEAFSESIANGRVISVNPAPGTVVDSGTTVELVVSKGPPPVEVPNLIDLRRKAAVEALERLGLRAQIDDGEFTRLNRVFDQSPSPGEMVPRGSTVTIRII